MKIIERFVRKRILEYLSDDGHSIYGLAKVSGVAENTIRSTVKNPDYNMGEINILKIAKAMELKPYEFFLINENCTYIHNERDIRLMTDFQSLPETEKCRVEGFLAALKREPVD